VVVELSPRFHPEGGRFLIKDYPKDQEHRRLKLSAQIVAKIEADIRERGLGEDDLLFAMPGALSRPASALPGTPMTASMSAGARPGAVCASRHAGRRCLLKLIQSGRPSTGRSASTGIVAPAVVDQAQVRAGAERAIVRYQEPPARFSAPRTRKKAAHP